MVNVAQSVERQVVVLVAVGSIPTIHPIFYLKIRKKNSCRQAKKNIHYQCI